MFFVSCVAGASMEQMVMVCRVGGAVRPGSPGRVTTLRRAYAVRGGGRVGTRCCAPPPRVTRPVYGLAFYKTPAGFYHASDTRNAPAPEREYYHRTCAPTRDCFTEHHRSTAHGPRHTPTPHYYRLALAVLK
jgi:hypothetical protein